MSFAGAKGNIGQSHHGLDLLGRGFARIEDGLPMFDRDLRMATGQSVASHTHAAVGRQFLDGGAGRFRIASGGVPAAGVCCAHQSCKSGQKDGGPQASGEDFRFVCRLAPEVPASTAREGAWLARMVAEFGRILRVSAVWWALGPRAFFEVLGFMHLCSPVGDPPHGGRNSGDSVASHRCAGGA